MMGKTHVPVLGSGWLRLWWLAREKALFPLVQAAYRTPMNTNRHVSCDFLCCSQIAWEMMDYPRYQYFEGSDMFILHVLIYKIPLRNNRCMSITKRHQWEEPSPALINTKHLTSHSVFVFLLFWSKSKLFQVKLSNQQILATYRIVVFLQHSAFLFCWLVQSRFASSVVSIPTPPLAAITDQHNTGLPE